MIGDVLMNYYKENIDITQAEIQQRQMEKDLMYQNMITEGKLRQEEWKLKMGLTDSSEIADVLKDAKQEEKNSRIR